jgi:hypothetical protein
MSEPIEIDGFPVPPGLPSATLWNIENADLSTLESDDIYEIQSIGYRAWMDEAERQLGIASAMEKNCDNWGEKEASEYSTACGLYTTAAHNAERCRVWRGEGATN